MKINWTVRINNKAFWITIVPVILLLIQEVASVFGYVLDVGELGNKLLNIVELIFIMLGLCGIITDPTTEGVSDSLKALTYVKPKKAGDKI